MSLNFFAVNYDYLQNQKKFHDDSNKRGKIENLKYCPTASELSGNEKSKNSSKARSKLSKDSQQMNKNRRVYVSNDESSDETTQISKKQSTKSTTTQAANAFKHRILRPLTRVSNNGKTLSQNIGESAPDFNKSHTIIPRASVYDFIPEKNYDKSLYLNQVHYLLNFKYY